MCKENLEQTVTSGRRGEIYLKMDIVRGACKKKKVKGRRPIFEVLMIRNQNKTQPFSEDDDTSQEMLPMKFTQISFQTQTRLVEEQNIIYAKE